MNRICNYFNNNFENNLNSGMWAYVIIPQYCDKYLECFKNNDYINCKDILEHINNTTLTYGYDICLLDGVGSAEIIFKTLKFILPELQNENIEEILILLDKKLGFYVDFPDIFDYSCNASITSSRGKISFRMVFALFYIYTIKETLKETLKENKKLNILEIGAGTGRTAYYAYKAGFKKYTIVDTLSTGVVQAHYNFNVLGEENVLLYGEEPKNQFLTLIPSHHFNQIKETYDIIVNFDGLTEYGIKTAQDYLNYSKKISNLFLSINHTSNEFNIKDLNCNLISSELCDYRLDSPNLIYYKDLIQL